MRRLSPLARVVCTAAMVSVSEREFRRLAAGAVQSGTPLDFSGKTVMLSEPLKVEQDQVLRVVGGSIAGDGHSVFQAGGGRSGLLSLTDVEISHHASPERQEKRSLGAAVFGRGKARVSLHGCSITSEAGFGLWLVQKCSMTAAHCDLPRCGRSTVVAFENSRLEVSDSSITRASMHAVCARGSSRITIRDSHILHAEVRAVYCYHSSHLDMSGSRIEGTRRPEAAAIQVDALRSDDASRLSLSDNTFADNAGGDVSVSGNVERCIRGDFVERTAGISPDTSRNS